MSNIIIFLATHFYRALLCLYPAMFRQQYGAQMTQTFRDTCRHALNQAGILGVCKRALFETRDVLLTAPVEHHAAGASATGFLRELASSLVMVAVIFFVVELFTPRYIVEGKSMQPNLDDGQRLIAGRVGVFPGNLEHGDVVVLRYAAQPENEPPLVKRLIGLPGDTVEIKDRQVYRDGQLLEEPYIKEPCDQWHCQNKRWVLGDDQYFVMGDNRNHSNDSRFFGPVSGEYLLSRVLFRYWPLNSLGLVSGE